MAGRTTQGRRAEAAELPRGFPLLDLARLRELRRTGRPDLADASGAGRTPALDRRGPVPPRAELLHAAAGTRGDAACRLHRVAPPSDPRRARRGHRVRAAELLPAPGALVGVRRRTAISGGWPGPSRGWRRPWSRSSRRRPVRLARTALANGLMVGVAVASFVAIFVLDVPFPIVIAVAVAVRTARRDRPALAVRGGRGTGARGARRRVGRRDASNAGCRPGDGTSWS